MLAMRVAALGKTRTMPWSVWPPSINALARALSLARTPCTRRRSRLTGPPSVAPMAATASADNVVARLTSSTGAVLGRSQASASKAIETRARDGRIRPPRQGRSRKTGPHLAPTLRPGHRPRKRDSPISRRLEIKEFGIQSRLIHQLRVSPLLDEVSFLQHQDPVRHSHGRE